MNTNKSKQKKRTIVSLMLIGAILIGGAFAFLTAQDSKTNVFTIGKIDIELWEKFDTNTNGTIDDGETYDASTKTPSTVENILPGQSILKEPYVVNKSSTPCHLYMTVSIPTLAVSEAFVENAGDSLTISGDKKIEVKAYAIQDGYSDKTDVAEIWNAYFEKNITSFGEDGDLNRIQMFNLNGIGSDWGQLGGAKAVKNTDENGATSYSNIYIYAYKGTATVADEATTYDYLLPGNETSQSLFTSVTMNKSIGSPTVVTVDGMTMELVNVTAKTIIQDGDTILEIQDEPIAPVFSHSYYICGLKYNLKTEAGKDAIKQAIKKTLFADFGDSVSGDIAEITIKTSYANANPGGTGTVVTAKIENNSDYFIFTVIYYGDVNGDATINAMDAMILSTEIAGEATFDSVQQKAMDLNHDGKIDDTDYKLLQLAIAKTATINQEKGIVVDKQGNQITELG